MFVFAYFVNAIVWLDVKVAWRSNNSSGFEVFWRISHSSGRKKSSIRIHDANSVGHFFHIHTHLLTSWSHFSVLFSLQGNSSTLGSHHISYNSYLIHSTIISHTLWNQPLYLIQSINSGYNIAYIFYYLGGQGSYLIQVLISMQSFFNALFSMLMDQRGQLYQEPDFY